MLDIISYNTLCAVKTATNDSLSLLVQQLLYNQQAPSRLSGAPTTYSLHPYLYCHHSNVPSPDLLVYSHI